MKNCLMTLRADPGICDLEKPVIDRTMRLMAVGAVLHDRRMLPEEGSAPFRMAHITGFIDARLF